MTFILIGCLLLFQAAQERSSVQGIVVKAGTNEPVVRAGVLLIKSGGQLSDARTATTDSLGSFNITNIAPARIESQRRTTVTSAPSTASDDRTSQACRLALLEDRH